MLPVWLSITEVPIQTYPLIYIYIYVCVRSIRGQRSLPSLMDMRSARVMHLGLSLCIHVCMSGHVTKKTVAPIGLIF